MLVVGLFLILVGVNWYLIKQREARLGLARPVFPYTKYSQDELDKMYPQYPNENVPTRVTPEETYAKLIAALKVGNLAEASLQFTAGQQAEWLESLKKIQEKGLLDEMVGDLGNIEKRNADNIRASYEVIASESGRNIGRPIVFIKDSNGDWKIKSL